MMSWTRVWSPTVITESRIAFSRLVTSRVQANADKDLQKEFGIGGLQTFTDLNGGLPTIVPEGYDGGAAPGGAEWLPTLEYSNVWDFIQNVSVNKGNHAYKMGFEYRPIGFPFFQVPSPRGTMRFQRNRTQSPQFPGGTGDGIAGWLLGYPGNSRITSANFVSSDKVSYAGYFQDDWKLSPKLTLNLGSALRAVFADWRILGTTVNIRSGPSHLGDSKRSQSGCATSPQLRYRISSDQGRTRPGGQVHDSLG